MVFHRIVERFRDGGINILFTQLLVNQKPAEQEFILAPPCWQTADELRDPWFQQRVDGPQPLTHHNGIGICRRLMGRMWNPGIRGQNLTKIKILYQALCFFRFIGQVHFGPDERLSGDVVCRKPFFKYLRT